MVMVVDWAELPPDLLFTIAKNLNLYEDFTAFGGVCRSWRSVAVKNNFCPVNVPWLLLAPREDDGDGVNNNSRDLYSLTKGGMVHKVHLPEARGKMLLSSLGWLITVDNDGDMELLHPLSRARIPLPNAREFPYFKNISLTPISILAGAALSASPSDTDDYTLMIVMIVVAPLFRLAYWKPGNTAWVTIMTHGSGFQDLVYHCGQFYAINYLGELYSLDVINGRDPTANLVGTIPTQINGYHSCHLAESGGHLLAVVWQILRDNPSDPITYEFAPHYHCGIDGCILQSKTIHNYLTSSFQVYRYDSSSNTNNWHVMNDLGGRSLFLGEQCAPVSVPAAAVGAIRPDCIYFTDETYHYYAHKDDMGRSGIDMGVYSLKEQRADTLYQGGTKGRRCFRCVPLWVIPSF